MRARGKENSSGRMSLGVGTKEEALDRDANRCALRSVENDGGVFIVQYGKVLVGGAFHMFDKPCHVLPLLLTVDLVSINIHRSSLGRALHSRKVIGKSFTACKRPEFCFAHACQAAASTIFAFALSRVLIHAHEHSEFRREQYQEKSSSPLLAVVVDNYPLLL
ncbi:uncharacterized protein A4U43_C01F31570 [Asparagus officinalis]|uniref:Uncharacterized protein n=1 Tax=Asparagus officinalis TaxID=4686 RepID=A0A5P1FWI9_ASPOF|nr:uncharacterized protein A4U43_C01F31570 [Asparagus officinalis]